MKNNVNDLQLFIIELLVNSGFGDCELTWYTLQINGCNDLTLTLMYRGKNGFSVTSYFDSMLNMRLVDLLNSIDWLQGFYLNDNQDNG